MIYNGFFIHNMEVYNTVAYAYWQTELQALSEYPFLLPYNSNSFHSYKAGIISSHVISYSTTVLTCQLTFRINAETCGIMMMLSLTIANINLKIPLIRQIAWAVVK